MELLKQIKNSLSGTHTKKISKNIIALSLMNAVTFLSPLLLIPYLIRVLGAESYGVYIFYWTFISYFILLVNYGYDLYATKEVATNRNDKDFLSAFFSSVTISRILLSFVGLLIVVLCVLFIPEFTKHKLLILFGSGVFIGQALLPTWIFQGMEEMKYITIITVITRVVPIGFIFLFVDSPEELPQIMLFQSLGYLIGGIVSILLVFRLYKLRFVLPSFSDVFLQLHNSWYLFLSSLGIAFYRETNVMILGFVTGNYTYVGYYSLADKFIRLFQMAITPIGQALFPYFGNNFQKDKVKAFLQIKKTSRYFLLFLLFLAVVLFSFSDLMTELYLGAVFPNINIDIKIMSIIIVFSGFSYLYGVVGLINLAKEKLFTLYVFIAGFSNILLCFFLSKLFDDLGAAISITIAEFILFVLIYLSYIKEQKLFSK